MPRKGPVAKDPVVADPVYSSPVVTSLINKILMHGKRSTAEAKLMQINFDGKILAADVENRTITGMVVPFGVSGRTSAGEVVFEFGSFQQFKAEEIILNKEHRLTN